MRSTGFRFLVVALLALLMFIPQFFAGSIVQERAYYADQTTREIGREWGGAQTLSGPFLVIPVEATQYRTAYRRIEDPVSGITRREAYRQAYTVERDPILLLPEALDAQIDTTAETRQRAIFEVPVYAADITMDATFDPDRAREAMSDDERLVWDAAVLRLTLTGNSGLRGATTITGPDGPLDLEPYRSERVAGIEGRITALTETTSFRAQFSLNGSNDLFVVPSGRDTVLRMVGDWPDPSFRGHFLPDAHAVSETGYEATWTVPHLARPLPQATRGTVFDGNRFAFGTSFIEVADFYQTAWRAARYGILFIGLTFLTILLIERKDRPTHPVQYIFIGMAQSLFPLLMVAYAEQIGFTLAYLLSAVATVGLLTLFSWIGLKLGQRTWAVGGLLATLYAVLYVILQSTDLALVAGATLAFAALALTIVLTRNEDWYGAGGPGNGFRRKSRSTVPPVAQAKAASSAISTMSPKED